MACSRPEDHSLMEQDTQQLFNNLFSFPPEVLLKIFTYLPVSILIQLDRSNVKRIREISCSINCLDFQGCSPISTKQLKNFLCMRCHIITELNFNNVLLIKPAVILKAITCCKNIRVLSIKHCGLSFDDIFKVFKICQNIEAFSWSGLEEEITFRYKALFNSEYTKNIRKLDIEILDCHILELFDMYILRQCPMLEELRLVLFRQTDTRYFGNLFRSSGHSFPLPKLHSLTVHCNAPPLEAPFHQNFSCQDLKQLILTLCESKSPNTTWKKLWVQPTLTYFKNFSPTSLPADTSIKALSSPRLIRDLSNVNGFSMMGMESPEQYNIIKYAGGKHLTHLIAIPAIDNQTRPPVLDFGLSPFASIMRVCTNITHLDFRKVHFVKDCVQKITACALISLKDLKKLSLTTCAITGQKPPNCSTLSAESYLKKMRWRRSEGHSPPQEQYFAQMVSSCTLLEAFEIRGCAKCRDSYLMDEDLSAMHRWPKLKSLVIENIPSLQRCSFLQKIPEGCQNFQSLQLSNAGRKEVCKFAPYVISILKNAKQLTFLRIRQPMFNTNDDTFWKAISRATNLQGICITADIRQYLLTKTITNEVSKLQKIQFFHFYSDELTDDRQYESMVEEIRNVLKEQKREYDLDVAMYPDECQPTSHKRVYNAFSTTI